MIKCIAIVGNDDPFGDLLADKFQREGWTVFRFGTGADPVDAVASVSSKAGQIDILVLNTRPKIEYTIVPGTVDMGKLLNAFEQGAHSITRYVDAFLPIIGGLKRIVIICLSRDKDTEDRAAAMSQPALHQAESMLGATLRPQGYDIALFSSDETADKAFEELTGGTSFEELTWQNVPPELRP